MLNKIKKDNKGFTIIEVLIVLAIAGLIMLTVFLAVPSLQRSSRNTQRQNDATKVAAAISTCMTNRNGQIDSCNEETKLVSNGSLDKEKLAQIETINLATTAPTDGVYNELNFGYGVKCTKAGDATEAGTTRQAAVLFRQENTGVGSVKCIDL